MERKKGRKGEKYQCVRDTLTGCLSHPPAPGQQPRHVSWLGIEPATLWFKADAQSTEPHEPGSVF